MILRCRAPRARLRFDGDTCNGYVIDVPDWMAPEFVRLLAHSSLRDEPDTITPACTRCGFVHEIALRGVARLRSAA